MKQAETNIADVTAADMVKPSSTARPILVAQRTQAADPMLTEAAANPAPTPDQSVTRTAKTIKPLVQPSADTTEVAPDKPEVETAPVPDAEAVVAVAAQPAIELSTPESPQKVAEAEPTTEASDDQPAESSRDNQAAQEAALAERAAAQEARSLELEKLIEAGTYSVPIDAVRRKRSRMFVIAMSLLAVVLAVLLLDVISDAGVIKLPDSVPHTHFFANHT